MSAARRRAPWLATLTGLYLFWSLAPVLIAVLFSFNAGRSRTEWQGFSFQWYFGEPDRSVWADQALQTALVHTFRLGILVTLIAVPLGTLMALGLDRWRGRLPTGASFLVMLSFVLPEILLAIALLFVATAVNEVFTTPVQLGTMGQVIGLVTFQVSYPVIIVRARLLTIGHQYEEAAVDLGASPTESLRRVLLPLAWPAILASAVLVFADVIDDFVLVRYLSGGSTTEPVSVKIYNTARAAPTPALNAIATLVLVASLLAVLLGYLAYRRMTRGEDQRTVGIDAFTGEA
jgi:spermidine/putrescine transport system permease protein